MATDRINFPFVWHLQADGIRVYSFGPPDPLPLGPGPFPDELVDFDPT